MLHPLKHFREIPISTSTQLHTHVSTYQTSRSTTSPDSDYENKFVINPSSSLTNRAGEDEQKGKRGRRRGGILGSETVKGVN